MAPRKQVYLALDVGAQRIGVALGDSQVKLAYPLTTLSATDDTINQQIIELLDEHQVDQMIVGYPRNQSGEATAQTHAVEQFISQYTWPVPYDFQDESLTSVIAEQRLGGGRMRDKGRVDAEAASIILQDYLEATYGS